MKDQTLPGDLRSLAAYISLQGKNKLSKDLLTIADYFERKKITSIKEIEKK